MNDKAMPTLRVRRSTSLIDEQILKQAAFQVPVYNFLNKNTKLDDITPGGCTYAYTYNNDHWNKEQTYEGVSDFIMPVLREPVGKAFGLTPQEIADMSFVNMYWCSDILLAENMEGIKPRYNFTAIQWNYIRAVQKMVLIKPICNFARDLWITKQFIKPINSMKQRVKDIIDAIDEQQNRDTLRYVLYSAHDV